MDAPDLATGGLGALAGAVVTGILGWLTKRTEKAPDVQTTINAAVDGVVAHYARALERSDAEAVALRREVAELRRLVEDQTARIEDQSQRITDQSAEIEGLVSHIGRLEAAIVDLGGNPPPRRKRAAPVKAKCEVSE